MIDKKNYIHPFILCFYLALLGAFTVGCSPSHESFLNNDTSDNVPTAYQKSHRTGVFHNPSHKLFTAPLKPFKELANNSEWCRNINISAKTLSEMDWLIPTPLGLNNPSEYLIDLAKKDVKKSKNHFLCLLIPYVMLKNEEMLDLRTEIKGLKDSFVSNVTLSNEQKSRVAYLLYRFKVWRKPDELAKLRHGRWVYSVMSYLETDQVDQKFAQNLVATSPSILDGLSIEDFNKLLIKVDIIPPGMILAQGIEESGWGRISRYAKKGNNIFSVQIDHQGLTMRSRKPWTRAEVVAGVRKVSQENNGYCMIPKKRTTRCVYAYPTLLDTFGHYYDRINSSSSYKRFRKARQNYTKRGSCINSQEILSSGVLDKYAEKKHYGRRLVEGYISSTANYTHKYDYLQKIQTDCMKQSSQISF